MKYAAIVRKEGRHTLIEFPDCPGCQTFAEQREDLHAIGEEALTGWLEANLVAGRTAPMPRKRPRDVKVLWIDIPAKLAVKIGLRWNRNQRGLTQAQLARLAGVSQPQIAKLEDPDSNPTVDTLEKVAKALGLRLEIAFAGGLPAAA